MNGKQMELEIAEQPSRLRELIARAPEIAELIRAHTHEPLHGVTLIARGSSDHAAVYGRYLLEMTTGKPVSLAAPSLHTLYRTPVDYHGQLVIAISQSGATPEIVRTLHALQAAGGRGLAITNEAGSELTQVADATIELRMGPELAVPATKTVTGQLVAMAIVAGAVSGAETAVPSLAAVPGWIERVVADPEPPARLAAALTGSGQLVVVARGFMYAAALETALKVRETCHLVAEGYSVADLRHGPIAAVSSDVPVVALATSGPAQGDVHALVDELRARGVPVHLVSPAHDADVRLPNGMPEELAPIVATVRGQQLARQLALALGHDPDKPSGLNKVTMT